MAAAQHSWTVGMAKEKRGCCRAGAVVVVEMIVAAVAVAIAEASSMRSVVASLPRVVS